MPITLAMKCDTSSTDSGSTSRRISMRSGSARVAPENSSTAPDTRVSPAKNEGSRPANHGDHSDCRRRPRASRCSTSMVAAHSGIR